MKIHDISVKLDNDTPFYPGDPRVAVETVFSLEKGDPAHVSRITLASHSGTHLDAPGHMLAGAPDLPSIPLERLMGKALVADLRGHREIGAAPLESIDQRDVKRLLLKTDNSLLWRQGGFVSSYVPLSPDGARYLSESGVELVGIDYLSVESFAGDGSVHRMLLARDIVILEGLDLSEVPEGAYELICLPLKVAAPDGAPARAVLREIFKSGEARR